MRPAAALALLLLHLLPSHATRDAAAPTQRKLQPRLLRSQRQPPPLIPSEAQVAEERRLARRAGWVRFAREMAAGGLAEAAMDAVLYPVDTLKARRQAARRLNRVNGAPSIRELLSLGSPVRGIVPVIFSAIPAGASFMSTKWCLELLAHRVMRVSTHGAGVTMAASACADVMYWAFRFPTETGKLRVQAMQDKSTLAAVRRLLHEGGYKPAVLYTGWQTVLWRDVPYDALEVRRRRPITAHYRLCPSLPVPYANYCPGLLRPPNPIRSVPIPARASSTAHALLTTAWGQGPNRPIGGQGPRRLSEAERGQGGAQPSEDQRR
jgi:hypothetical protein